MVSVFEFLLIAFVSFILLQAFFLSIQVLASFLPFRDRLQKVSPFPKTAILIPAHNEEAVIADTLEKMKVVLPDNSSIIVIADNCSDNTAQIAESSGVQVLVRENLEERGKGFALSHGIEYLRADPPEVVIVIDADCDVYENTIEHLVSSVTHTGRTSQALDLMTVGENAKLQQQIAAFAFAFKNHARLLGMKKLGMPCNLLGTGMAFPWDIIKDAKLATGNIVEDIQLGIDLVQNNKPALFVPTALVTSQFPDSLEALNEQKTRWEHGHLQTLLSQSPSLALSRLLRLDLRGVFFALDLAIPPLTVLLALVFLGFGTSFIVYLLGFSAAPFVLSFLSGVFFAVSLILGWLFYGQDYLPFQSIRGIPKYIFGKFPVYWNYIFNRQKSWIRTDRS